MKNDINKQIKKDFTAEEGLRMAIYGLFAFFMFCLGLFLIDYGYICFIPFVTAAIMMVDMNNRIEQKRPIKYSKRTLHLMLVPILFLTIVFGIGIYLAFVESQTFREGLKRAFFDVLAGV